MSERAERVAENETRFRKANEDLVGEFERMELEGDRHVPFICECGDRDCSEVILLTLAEYEAVRGDANTFAIVVGHADSPTERVVTESIVDANDRFAVVRKREDYRSATEGSDPRAG